MELLLSAHSHRSSAAREPCLWWLPVASLRMVDVVVLSAGASTYRSVLAGNGLSFATNGQTWNGSASVERMVMRDGRTKLSISAGFALLDTQNFIQGIQLRTSSYRIVTGKVGARWLRKIGQSQVNVSGSFERGLGLFGAHTVVTGPGGATGRYNLVSLDVAWQMPFSVGPTRLTNGLALRGQWSFDNLFSGTAVQPGRPFHGPGLSGRWHFRALGRFAARAIGVRDRRSGEGPPSGHEPACRVTWPMTSG